jgi:hypothetical protein
MYHSRLRAPPVRREVIVKYSFAGAVAISALSFSSLPVFAQTCPTPLQHPEPNDATGWANAINGCLPQAVPLQSVGLGTFEAAAPPYRGMFWDPALVPCVVVGPRGGFDRWCYPGRFPVPTVRINSWNVQYEIAITNKPANYDLQVRLTTPSLQGDATTYTGTLNADGDRVTIPFHPDIVGTQVLDFLHAGEKIASYEINTTLEPQLGAFVVPYLPVAIVYQPPGAESRATYTLGSSLGTRLCWGTSGAAGNIETKDASLFFGKKSEYIGHIAKAAGAVGLIPQVAWVGAVGKALDALDGLYHTQTTHEQTETEGRTLCQGSDVSVSVGQATEPGHGDLFLLRKDALFAYVVVLKDPASGNIVATNGVPTVILTLVHSRAEPAVYLEDLERDYPPYVVEGFTELDLQMHPLLLKKNVPETFPDISVGGLRRARLKRLPDSASPQYCRPNSTTIVDWNTSFFTETDLSEATTKTTTTHVTGLLASIYGEDEETSVSITLASNQANWQEYQQGSRIELRCPEIHPPYQSWKMDIYLDKVFGTLLAVPGEKYTTTDPPQIAGVLLDASGRPVADRELALSLGGTTVRVRTGSDGAFAFHVRPATRGDGTISVGRQSFRVPYRGRPITNLRFRLTRP